MSVESIIKGIQEKKPQKAVNMKDELVVMKEMLNDHDFKASVYGKEGIEGYVCPAEDIDLVVSNVIAKTTGVNTQEAQKLAADYEYTNQDAQSMINVSKEFVNVYMDTGRKLSFGKREDSDISIIQKNIPAGKRHISKKTGIDENGKDIRETVYVDVKAHKSLKVVAK